MNYEVASLRKLSRAPQEASPGAAQMFNKSKLVWRHILASLNGLKSGLKLGVSIGQDEIADLGHLKDKGVQIPIICLWLPYVKMTLAAPALPIHLCPRQDLTSLCDVFNSE